MTLRIWNVLKEKSFPGIFSVTEILTIQEGNQKVNIGLKDLEKFLQVVVVDEKTAFFEKNPLKEL